MNLSVILFSSTLEKPDLFISKNHVADSPYLVLNSLLSNDEVIIQIEGILSDINNGENACLLKK